MARQGKKASAKKVETLTHEEARRRNIPTAEMQSFAEKTETAQPEEVRYPRETPLTRGERRARNGDLDPQLVWRGKDEQDWSDLVAVAPPLYIQEKVHPKAIIDGLRRQARKGEQGDAPDLFGDFNGLDDPEAKTEFYAHDQHWSNRMILGDSLQVMASLAEKEQLRGKVQCIYFDPPYGIKFNSNWQVSTRSRDVKDGKADQITREPEQVKAFRDTWKDGIHSYLTYLRDRLTVARDLLSESGSIFVQIGDENVHRVRALMDEVFGEDNLVSEIIFVKTSSQSSAALANVNDYILWYCKSKESLKYRPVYSSKQSGGTSAYSRIRFPDSIDRPMTRLEKQGIERIPDGGKIFRIDNLTSQRPPGDFPVNLFGKIIRPRRGYWKTGEIGFERLQKANRVALAGSTPSYVRFIDDFPVSTINNVWTDTTTAGFASDKVYVVQTLDKIVERCILMTTDPGDLVLDPTCGSGTTATVAENWGRRWITIDTSRVALALARTRIMGARYPYYLLADSPEGQWKAAELAGKAPPETPTHGDLRHGFVYKRVPHITLKAIANNAEIDVIWDKWQETLEPLRAAVNAALGRGSGPSEGPPSPCPSPASGRGDEKREVATDSSEDDGSRGHRPLSPAGERDRVRVDTLSESAPPLNEWDLPREAPDDWPQAAKDALAKWWEARIARQREIDESIARNADQETLYDQPYQDTAKVRVAGPFTVESLSPHRVIPADEGELWDEVEAGEGKRAASRPDEAADFAEVVIDHLKMSGVQQSSKHDRIAFTSVTPWPGDYIAADGRFMEGDAERRAAVFIGPEFGTVARSDLVAAAREAMDAGFDMLIACAFNYDAHANDFNKLGPLQVIRARMNPDLHMADELKNTGTGNLFVVFGEPDVEIDKLEGGRLQVRIHGLDIFDPSKGAVRAGGTDDIAAWFIDTDYNEESFFVRHAYFLGANDPYKSLKTALKAEIDEDAWATLYSDTSRPFERPTSGRIAVKVINHFGDEVMQVFGV